MEITRVQIIFIIGLMAFAVRAVPQMFFVGGQFPESWDRWLRYPMVLFAALSRSRCSCPARASKLPQRRGAP
jgi:branched-subunit amino acid transport protein